MAPNRSQMTTPKSRPSPMAAAEAARPTLGNVDAPAKAGNRKKFAKREQQRTDKCKDAAYVDTKMSQRILEQARAQMEELEEEEQYHDHGVRRAMPALDANVAYLDESASDDEDGEMDGDNAAFGASDDDADDFANDTDFAAFAELDDDVDREMGALSRQDRDALAAFMSERPPERRSLADIIMEKFKEQSERAVEDEGDGHQKQGGAAFVPPGLNEKVVQVYQKVGELLARYKSGKLPKAFKIVPALANWEEILYLTAPHNWTPQAMYQATRLFASNLKPKMAQRFYNVILLDCVRTDIAETKRVNPHLYMALRKAIYKPSAWFKGILLPLCDSGCTLREAMVLASLLSKVSVPVLHSSAALLKIAEMEYTGANSIFIRVLLDKKYALPYRVIDALVFHFIQFKADQREMPVLWHQSLLVFAQRYKSDMTPEQKDALVDLVRHQVHHQISAEIRRELVNSTCRGEMMDEGDVAMLPATSQQAMEAAMQMRRR